MLFFENPGIDLELAEQENASKSVGTFFIFFSGSIH